MGMMIFIMILIMMTIITMATIITMSAPDVSSNQPGYGAFCEAPAWQGAAWHDVFSTQAMERFVKPRLDKELLGKERDLTAGQMMRLEAVRTNTIIMSQEENIIITMMMVSIILSD